MARAFTFVPGEGVVHAGRLAPAAAVALDYIEIRSWYERRGLSGDALINAVDRHERILRGADPEVAEAIRRGGRESARGVSRGA